MTTNGIGAEICYFSSISLFFLELITVFSLLLFLSFLCIYQCNLNEDLLPFSSSPLKMFIPINCIFMKKILLESLICSYMNQLLSSPRTVFILLSFSIIRSPVS